MPHVLVVDIDLETLAAIEDLVGRRAANASTMRFRVDCDDASRRLASSVTDPAQAQCSDGEAVNETSVAAGTSGFQSKEVDERSDRINGFSLQRFQTTLIFASWRLDVVAQELRSAGNTQVPLSPAEFELLYALAKHPHRCLTRRQIVHFMKAPGRPSCMRSIDVYVSRLRRKLNADAGAPSIIQTVRNGYKFAAAVTIR